MRDIFRIFTLTQAHAICNGYGIYSRLKMPFAIVCIASMRRVSIHISVRESPKDSHHFIFGLNYIRTDTLTRSKYAIRILLYILLCVRYEARSSSVGVFRLFFIFNVVSVALPSIVANICKPSPLPPCARESFSRSILLALKERHNFFSIHFVIGVCTSYDLFAAIYFRLNPFRLAPMIEMKCDDGARLAVTVTRRCHSQDEKRI